MINKLESMHEMAIRLRGTGGGEQANAVIEAIQLIRTTPGILDSINSVTAVWHLAAALSSTSRASQVIEEAALLVTNDRCSNKSIG